MIEFKDTVMGKEELVKLNDAMPSEAKYGDVFRSIAERQAEITSKAVKQEIGEAICILVGNTMLEDMEKGVLLGEQLRPIFERCKIN